MSEIERKQWVVVYIEIIPKNSVRNQLLIEIEPCLNLSKGKKSTNTSEEKCLRSLKTRAEKKLCLNARWKKVA